MKVAVIGAGRWGKNLIRTFSELEALSAVVETDERLRESLQTEWPHLPIMADIADLTLDVAPAVAIATPVPTHFSLANEALERGFDVFVEKPMALTSAEGEALCAMANKNSRILMVGHLLLYQPAIRWITECISGGSLGKVHSLHQERLNLGKARSAENVLWSLGVHDVAVLLSLVRSSLKRVKAEGQRVLQPRVEDDVYLHMEFDDGVQAHLHCAWLWPERRRRLTIVADRGMLIYDELEQTVTRHDKSIDAKLENVDNGSTVVFRQTEPPLRLELQHFLSRLKDRTPPLSDGENGVQVVRVLETASKLLEKP